MATVIIQMKMSVVDSQSSCRRVSERKVLTSAWSAMPLREDTTDDDTVPLVCDTTDDTELPLPCSTSSTGTCTHSIRTDSYRSHVAIKCSFCVACNAAMSYVSQNTYQFNHHCAGLARCLLIMEHFTGRMRFILPTVSKLSTNY